MNCDSRLFAPVDDLLVLASRVPDPAGDSEAVRAFHMLRYLGARYRVHVGCFYHPRRELALLGKIKPLCYETCFVPHAPLLGNASTPQRPDGTLSHWVARLLVRQPVRAALAMGAPAGAYLLPHPSLRRVADFCAADTGAPVVRGFHPVRRRRAAALFDLRREIARQFDSLTFGAPLDAAGLAQLGPATAAKSAALLDGVDADYFSPHIIQRSPYPAGVRALLLVGPLNDGAMIDAAEWFVRQVFAPLRARHPALRCYFPGGGREAGIARLTRQDGVIAAGALGDLRPWLAHAALAVAPLQRGVARAEYLREAMAMQTVLVASPQALAPLGLANHADVLEAHDASQFIAHIDAALGNPDGRAQAIAARVRMLADYRWSERLAPLCGLLDAAGHMGETSSA
ncbi:MAG: glycosyltransferase [Massilia sp.]